MALNGAEIYRLKFEQHLTWNQIAELSGEHYHAIRNRCRRYKSRLEHGEKPVISPPPQAEAERVTDQAEHNTREVESKSTRITTLAQLVDFCQIDLDVWAIERHVINKWEVGAKDPVTGQVLVEPLFQVKATLIKRHPEAVKPVISPVYIHTKPLPPPERKRGLRACLIISDIQFGFSRDVHRGTLTPFHDRRALDVVLQIARVLHPDRAAFVGDINDFSGWSDKFIRRPEFYWTTQPSLIEASWYMRQVRDATCGEVDAVEGNHDNRPERQIISHLLDAYQLHSADQLDAAPVMSVDNLLGLSRMGIKYHGPYPDADIWINSNTRIIHGEKVRAQSGQTAAAVVRDANENTVFGHIHKSELATRTIPTRDGNKTVFAYSPGCLCHIDGRVPGSSRACNWQQGAAVLWYNEDRCTIAPIDIENGKAIFAGELYQGNDYVEDLRHQTGWQF